MGLQNACLDIAVPLRVQPDDLFAEWWPHVITHQDDGAVKLGFMVAIDEENLEDILALLGNTTRA